ncbi:uncharacterized protein [Miscanthus floridulus]|uniref:uncharacterized protein n=1 Tax=Miscanthus floridulus TaxID=154761 RepID=UPI003457E4FA
MVDPIIGTKWLTKVLMDGGAASTSWAPFYGIVPGKQAMPLGQIDMPITFRNLTNYRTETLTFEVVEFHGTYLAILGHPCYVKFKAVPNYTYLKLKMLGPYGVTIIGTSFQRANECEVECCEHATAIVASKELAAIREEVIEEAPNPKWLAGSFEPIEGAKEVLIDPSGSKGKLVRIGTTLSSE